MKYKENLWEIKKEMTGKTKIIHNNLPEKLAVNQKNIIDKQEIANQFNKFFVNMFQSKQRKQNNQYILLRVKWFHKY